MLNIKKKKKRGGSRMTPRLWPEQAEEWSRCLLKWEQTEGTVFQGKARNFGFKLYGISKQP